MDKTFFNDFDAVSPEEWKERIVKDLRGKPYEGLLKQTKEGIAIQPDYSDAGKNPEGIPGEAPYIRGLKRTRQAWTIVEEFNASRGNDSVLNALNNGVTGLKIDATSNYEAQLKGVLFPYIAFYLNSDTTSAQASKFISFLEQSEAKADELQGSLGISPLASGLLQGEFGENLQSEIKGALTLSQANLGLSKVRFFNVNGVDLSNAGASASTELATALAQGHAYIKAALQEGISIDNISARIQFNLGIGTDFFMELTKFRVIRRLWARIIEQYQPEHACSHATYVYGETAKRFYSVADIHNNMLRATTMTAAAAIGGADAIHTLPFDEHLGKTEEFGWRIARNVNLLLQEESYLHNVLDPAAGSYFLDELAEQLCDKAWAFFQEIETAGGFEAACKTNLIQNKVESEANTELELLKDEKRVMVGVNKFPNDKDDLSGATSSTKPAEQQFKPLYIHRISESFEIDRK